MKRLRDLQRRGYPLWRDDVERAIFEKLRQQPWFQQWITDYIRAYEFTRLLKPYQWSPDTGDALVPEDSDSPAGAGEYAHLFWSIQSPRKRRGKARVYRLGWRQPVSMSRSTRQIAGTLDIPLQYTAIVYEDVCLN